MFLGYFAASALAIYATFGLPHAAETRLYLMFFVGLTVFGVFGSFIFYLRSSSPRGYAALVRASATTLGAFSRRSSPSRLAGCCAQGTMRSACSPT